MAIFKQARVSKRQMSMVTKMSSLDSAYDLGIAGINWAEVLPWLSGTTFFYTFTFTSRSLFVDLLPTKYICNSILRSRPFIWLPMVVSS